MITIATLGSHSALDICRGAKDEGFDTLVVCEKGREKPYIKYYKTKGKIGCVDECLILNKFSDILKFEAQSLLRAKKVVFVPHRSFEVYLNFDYKAIEQKWKVPTFGNKYLLKIEERNFKPNQYDLLESAKIPFPKIYKNPKSINKLCLVKVSEKLRKFERAFFLASSFDEFKRKSGEMIKSGKITKEALRTCVIEEFVSGAQVNFNFFYSPLTRRIELLGTDTRRQTNLDGILRIPAPFQSDVLKNVAISYEEAGHVAVTVLESMLEPAFKLAERFVKASQKLTPPGIIGPFALQSIITPGPPKKDIVVFDVSPRMPGSPGISSTPYGGYLFGESVSAGRRIAMEVKDAIDKKKLRKITT